MLIPRRNLETGEDMPGLMWPVCGSSYMENESPTGKFSAKQEMNNEYKQGEDSFYDNKTSRTIRTRKK